MPNNFAGIGEFTSALSQGGDVREKAFRGELSDSARITKALAQADMARRQSLAQQKIDSGIGAAFGMNPEQSEVLATLLLGGGGNAQALTGGVGNLFETASRYKAQQGAEAAGFTGPNAALAGLASKPLPTVDVDAGQIIANPYSASPTVSPTELTAAQALTQAALGNRANAGAERERSHAGVYDAQAEAGGFNPNGGGKRGKTNPKTKLEAAPGDEFVAAFRSDMGRDPSQEEMLALREGTLSVPIPGEAPATVERKGFSQAEAQQALSDARKAIQLGRLTKEEARERLIKAGLANSAKVL